MPIIDDEKLYYKRPWYHHKEIKGVQASAVEYFDKNIASEAFKNGSLTCKGRKSAKHQSISQQTLVYDGKQYNFINTAILSHDTLDTEARK